MRQKITALLKTERHALALQGALAIVFGAAAIWWPGITIDVLVYLFAGLLLANGAVSIITSFFNMSGNGGKYIIMMMAGLLEIIVSVYLFQSPDIAFETFVLLIGFILMARGALTLVRARSRRKALMTSRLLQGLLAALEVSIGVVFLIYPLGSMVALVWILGMYALLTGAVMIVMAADIGKTKQLKI